MVAVLAVAVVAHADGAVGSGATSGETRNTLTVLWLLTFTIASPFLLLAWIVLLAGRGAPLSLVAGIVAVGDAVAHAVGRDALAVGAAAEETLGLVTLEAGRGV